jgi:hypothetical protein
MSPNLSQLHSFRPRIRARSIYLLILNEAPYELEQLQQAKRTLTALFAHSAQ